MHGHDGARIARRLFGKAVQQGRSKRRGESYSPPYIEPLSIARTPLADFVNSLLGIFRIIVNKPDEERFIPRLTSTSIFTFLTTIGL
jgi:hypothetical protein